MRKLSKLLTSWRPTIYSFAVLAMMALAAGAKWRPR